MCESRLKPLRIALRTLPAPLTDEHPVLAVEPAPAALRPRLKARLAAHADPVGRLGAATAAVMHRYSASIAQFLPSPRDAHHGADLEPQTLPVWLRDCEVVEGRCSVLELWF